MSTVFSPPLNPRRIAAALAGSPVGGEVLVFDELPSTNDHVRELGLAGFPHGLVVLSESQSAGRGRRDNIWHAPPARDILMTVLLRPPARLELWPRATTLAALAVCRAIEAVTALRALIKWPNDVHVNDKKCAGILAETFAAPAGSFMALGIGLNVNSDHFSPDLRSSATSLLLEREGQQALDRNVIVIALLKEISRLMHRLDAGFEEVIRAVRPRSWLTGRRVTALVNQREVGGLVLDLDEQGYLVLQTDDGGLLTLNSAEQVRRA